MEAENLFNHTTPAAVPPVVPIPAGNGASENKDDVAATALSEVPKVAVCAICGEPIGGRIVFCASHWSLAPIAYRNALSRYYEKGPNTVQFQTARASAITFVQRIVDRAKGVSPVETGGAL